MLILASTNKIPTTNLLLRAALALIIISSTLGTMINYSHAESLENLMDSKAMQDFKISRTAKAHKNKGPPTNRWLSGVEPGTNFASIWTSSNTGPVLLNWVGAKLPFFHYRRARSTRLPGYVTAEVELSVNERNVAKLSIMVPHPSISPLVEANVFEEFRRLRPPMLEVLSQKPVPLGEHEGMLYEHKKGGGSLVIPIERLGLINISIVNYKNFQILLDIAKGLDIDRLNQKLSS